MTIIKITRTTINLLVALDNARSAGDPWAVFAELNCTEGSLQWAMRQGLVETDGQSRYRITEAGQWAMIRGETPDLDETPADAESEPSKHHPQVLAFLQHLANALNVGDGWVMSKTIPLSLSAYQYRLKAQRLGYVDARGAAVKRAFKINPKGLAQLGKTPAPAMPARLSDDERMQLIADLKKRVLAKKTPPMPHVPPLEPTALKVADVPTAPIHVHIEEAPADGCQCPDCIYRDVVALLEKHVPGVRDVVSGLMTITNK